MAALNTAQTQQHQRTPNVASTRAFVREIRLILQTRLPTELAMAIIDLAELRSHTIEIYRETERNGFPKRYSELSNRIAYISVLIPISDVHTLKQIEFYMKSRDQGYDWNHLGYRSYDESWTWFEVDIKLQQDGDLQDDPAHTIELWRSQDASGKPRSHTVIWKNDATEEEEVREVIKSLRGGGSLEVMPLAKLGAFNYVYEARIRVVCEVRW